MRYRLRTLLILLAVLPPLLWFGWTKYEAWRAERARLKALREIKDGAVYLNWTSDLAPIKDRDADDKPLPPPKSPPPLRRPN